jgi:beta-mannosidase
MQSIDLAGRWQFRLREGTETAPKGGRGLTSWMKATVPGTVHTDLMAAGKIPDPFYRMNEKEVQWIDLQTWVYRRTFTVPAPLLTENVIELVAEGLDTYAAISVNGRPVGATANMFIEHRLRLDGLLQAGQNTIEISFDSPTLRSLELEKEHGRLQVALEPQRVYVRKAQYSFGWDWGPKLTTSGIWRPIRIEAHSGERVNDTVVRVVSVSADRADIECEASVEGWRSGDLTLEVAREGSGEPTRVRVEGATVRARFSIDSPRLWWPNGYGGQPLYTAEMTLRKGDKIVDRATVPFAIRTVRLIQEPDEEGRSFILEINGTKVFCKGADWIPVDTFLPRATDDTYRRLLTMARDASMNMIRVWGGGIYERECFYSECDRLGLMVWQDFMFACGEYPDHLEFLDAAKLEGEAVVRRLRNHPSIVLWCGNNECEWIYCTDNPGKGPDDMRGATIFREVLRSVVDRLDPTRPYWRSTPFGAGFPNAQDNGNHHQWEVWSGWTDFTAYRRDTARFISEFGFQAPANRETIERALPPADRTPQSPGMEHHNKQVAGTERIFRFLASHYAVSGRWEDFLYTGQLLQAEALKCAVEHWRRRKFRTAGALFWQLNDCWPVSSWSVVDSELRPKAGYFAAKRFFAPVLVSFAPVPDGLEVWGTNDLLREVEGRLTLRLQSFAGKVLATKALPVRLGSNGAERLFAIPAVWLKKGGPGSYLVADLAERGRTVAVNRFLFVEPKHCEFPPAAIRLGIRPSGPGQYRATLTSKVYAHGVVLTSRRDGVVFHDNFVDLDPGTPFDITVTTKLSAVVLRKSLSIHALNIRTRKTEV